MFRDYRKRTMSLLKVVTKNSEVEKGVDEHKNKTRVLVVTTTLKPPTYRDEEDLYETVVKLYDSLNLLDRQVILESYFFKTNDDVPLAQRLKDATLKFILVHRTPFLEKENGGNR